MIRAPDQTLDGAYLTCRIKSFEGLVLAQDSIMIRVRKRQTEPYDTALAVRLEPTHVNVTIGQEISLTCSLLNQPISERFVKVSKNLKNFKICTSIINQIVIFRKVRMEQR